jgi:transposase
MLIPYEGRKLFRGSEPIDMRMSIDGLSKFIHREINENLHDGSIYVFYNKNMDKLKLFFWDRNGFVVYYKKLVNCKFKIKKIFNSIEPITGADLDILISGFDPQDFERMPALLEHGI